MIPADEFVPSEAAKAKAKEIVAKIITSNMSEYDCVKAIHDYLIINVNYDLGSIMDGSIDNTSHPSHTVEGALCKKLAVCDGYAQAFELLCAEAGIYAYMMYGESINAFGDTESHAWNVVKIDDQWYQIDCTWDDPIINGGVVTDGSNLSYAYFLLTDTEMYTDHVLDSSWSKNAKKCTSTLYKGLAQRLSIEASMTYEGAVLTDINGFYTKTTEYLSKSKTKFSLAVPIAESNKLDGNAWQQAVVDGLTAGGFVGNFEYGYESMQVGDYMVYNIVFSEAK